MKGVIRLAVQLKVKDYKSYVGRNNNYDMSDEDDEDSDDDDDDSGEDEFGSMYISDMESNMDSYRRESRKKKGISRGKKASRKREKQARSKERKSQKGQEKKGFCKCRI